jgi:hypothetical protein
MPDVKLFLAFSLLFSAFSLFPSDLRAHPVHTSAAEADYNAATSRLEISIPLDADDTETALSRRTGRRISLEKTPGAELDALLQAWLAEKFLALDRAGTARKIQWVGRELRETSPHYTLWLHCEAPLPGGVEGARLAHLLLLDEIPRQENVLRVRAAGRECILSFRPGDPAKPVTLR